MCNCTNRYVLNDGYAIVLERISAAGSLDGGIIQIEIGIEIENR
jgi:hypothetical protein